MNIERGATAEVGYTVGEDQTAHAMGNRGVHVFATPFVIGLLEDAAGAVLRPHLPPGAGSVGTMVEMKHLAATPVGLKVRAKATLLESDGKRYPVLGRGVGRKGKDRRGTARAVSSCPTWRNSSRAR